MKQLIFFISIISILVSYNKTTISNSEEQLLRIPYISTVDTTEREYFVYLLKNYNKNKTKKWPILLFLHGNGERGNGKGELNYTLIHGPLFKSGICPL